MTGGVPFLERLHERPYGIEDYAKLGVVLLFELSELAGKVGVRGEQAPEADEAAHDLDVDQDGARTAQYAGQHGHALFGKGVGEVSAAAPVRT